MNTGSILKYETRPNQACLSALINSYLAFSQTEGLFDPGFVKSLREQEHWAKQLDYQSGAQHGREVRKG